MNRYILSPEFHRNLWVNFSVFRFLAVPLLVGLGCLAIMNMDGGEFDTLITTSLISFWLVTIVWGSSVAANTMQDEIRNNTWDFQRTSSISPLQYALGKFFGATSYIWYFGFILWAVFAIAWFLDDPYHKAFTLIPPPPEQAAIFSKVGGDLYFHLRSFHNFVYVTIFMVLSGIFAQAFAFYEGCRSLTQADKWRGRARWRGNISGFIGGIFLGSTVFLALVFREISGIDVRTNEDFYSSIKNLQWHGFDINGLNMIAFTLLFFTGWLLVGLCRFIKEGLLCRTWPVAWPLFILTLILYCTGFSDSAVDQIQQGCALAFILTYLVMFKDVGNNSLYRRLANTLQKGDKSRIAENMPLWATSFTVMLVLYIGMFLYPAADLERTTKAITLITAAIFFMLRDGFVLHAIFWRKAHDKFIAVTYYLAAYLLVPALHSNLSLKGMGDFFKAGKSLETPSWISASYFPTYSGQWWISIIPPAIQACLAAGLLVYIVKKSAAKTKT